MAWPGGARQAGQHRSRETARGIDGAVYTEEDFVSNEKLSILAIDFSALIRRCWASAQGREQHLAYDKAMASVRQ